MSKLSRRRGKDNERAVLKLLQHLDEELRRLGVLGEEDLVGRYVVVECKSRQSLPQWLSHAFEQLRSSRHPDRIHVVQLHLHRKRHLDDLIMMTLDTFIRLLEAFVRQVKR